MLSVLKAVVQLLVGELKSHKLHGIVKKKRKQKKKKKDTATPQKKNKNKNKNSTTYKIEKGGNI